MENHDPTRILSIEDNPAEQFLIETYVSEIDPNCKVEFIDSAEEAGNRLSKLNEDQVQSLPDLVLLDLNLPDGDGLNVLRQIRSLPRIASLPVIVFSNSRNQADILQSLTYRANAFITKPATDEEFHSTMLRILTVELPSYRRATQESVA